MLSVLFGEALSWAEGKGRLVAGAEGVDVRCVDTHFRIWNSERCDKRDLVDLG